MGIDVYVQFDGQTKQESEAQITGFSITSGGVGYLREAYHGEPYATRYLVSEAFDANEGSAQIPAATLRERLAQTQALAIERAKKIYNETVTLESSEIKTFAEFVEYCERAEAKTGKPCTIIASY